MITIDKAIFIKIYKNWVALSQLISPGKCDGRKESTVLVVLFDCCVYKIFPCLSQINESVLLFTTSGKEVQKTKTKLSNKLKTGNKMLSSFLLAHPSIAKGWKNVKILRSFQFI